MCMYRLQHTFLFQEHEYARTHSGSDAFEFKYIGRSSLAHWTCVRTIAVTFNIDRCRQLLVPSQPPPAVCVFNGTKCCCEHTPSYSTTTDTLGLNANKTGTHCISEGDGYDYDDENGSTAFIVKLVERSDPTNVRKLSEIVHQNNNNTTIEFCFLRSTLKLYTTLHNRSDFRTIFLFCAILRSDFRWRFSAAYCVSLAKVGYACTHTTASNFEWTTYGFFSLLPKFIKNELCLCSDASTQTHERRTLCVIAAGNMHFAFDMHK